MELKDLVVPECDWNDFVKNPWTLIGNPQIAAEVEFNYINEYKQKLGVVGMNRARRELYGFYDGKSDVTHLVTVRFDYAVEIK